MDNTTQHMQAMRALLNSFLKGELPLFQLVPQLTAHLESISIADFDGYKLFDQKRFALEEVNALMLDRGGTGIPQLDKSFVAKTIKEMVMILDKAMRNIHPRN